MSESELAAPSIKNDLMLNKLRQRSLQCVFLAREYFCEEVALEVALHQINALYYNNDLMLQIVLTTHKHWDHQSGNLWLASKYSDELAFYSGEQSVLSRLRKANVGALLSHGDSLELRYTLVQDGCDFGAASGSNPTQRSASFEVAPGWRLRVDQVVMRAGTSSLPQRHFSSNFRTIPSLRFDVLATPCHTRGHVVFLLREVRLYYTFM